ncbi:MAG TPA: alginate lyase family protein [Silvibacterium sp.]|nr:alginate lyase family protein [Silvibacterium sp.]
MIKCLLLAAALLPAAAHAAGPLRSPWDGTRVKLTDATYACPAIVHLSPNLTTDRFYSDSKSSIIDPEKWKAYVATSGPYKALGDRIVDAADAFRTTGSRDAAECAIQHMQTAAKDGCFTGKMSSNQAYYVQGWVIGAIAIAYLKIRDSGLISTEQAHEILPWMVNVVRQTMDYYDTRRQKGTGDAENNHLYWAGVEISAAGIAANDRKLFDCGMDAYRVGVDQIQPDGSLPREMGRGQRALHYHLYALAPLVYLAEFGEDNGLNLYAEHDYALKKLAALSTQGLVNNSFFEKATGIAQDTPKGPPTAEEISWAKPYVVRFPDPAIESLLATAPSLSYMYLGGLPPG